MFGFNKLLNILWIKLFSVHLNLSSCLCYGSFYMLMLCLTHKPFPLTLNPILHTQSMMPSGMQQKQSKKSLKYTTLSDVCVCSCVFEEMLLCPLSVGRVSKLQCYIRRDSRKLKVRMEASSFFSTVRLFPHLCLLCPVLIALSPSLFLPRMWAVGVAWERADQFGSPEHLDRVYRLIKLRLRRPMRQALDPDRCFFELVMQTLTLLISVSVFMSSQVE